MKNKFELITKIGKESITINKVYKNEATNTVWINYTFRNNSLESPVMYHKGSNYPIVNHNDNYLRLNNTEAVDYIWEEAGSDIMETLYTYTSDFKAIHSLT